MKRKHVIATFALSALLGVGFFAGIHGNKAKEAKAVGTKTFYLLRNWDWGTPEIHYWGGSSPTTWDNNPQLVKIADSYTTDGQTGPVYSYDVPEDTKGIIIRRQDHSQQTANYEFTSWASVSTNAAYFEWKDNANKLHPFTYTVPTPEPEAVYKVAIGGGAAQTLVVNPDNADEYKLENDVTFTAGQQLVFTKDDAALAVTSKAAGQYDTNNVDTDLKIKKATTGNLYLDKTTNQVWVTGYGKVAGAAYLQGTFNTWSGIETTATVTENVAAFQNLDLAKDDIFKAFVYNKENNEDKYNWIGATSIAYAEDYGDEYTATIDDPDNDKNVKINQAGNYDITVNTSTGVYTIKANDYVPPVQHTYKLKINDETPVTLTKDGNQYEAKGITVAAGDTFAFLEDDTAYAVTAEDTGNNNYGKNGIRQAGTVDLYLKPAEGHFWVSGLPAPEEGHKTYYMLINDKNPVKMTYNTDPDAPSDDEYYLTHVELVANDEISFMYVSAAQEYPVYTHYNITTVEGIEGFYKEGNVVKTAGIYDLYADMTPDHNKLYVAVNHDGWVRYLDINGTKQAMTVNPDNDKEYKLTANLVAGDELAYYYGADAESATEQTSTAKAIYNNNLGADKKVLVDAQNADIYVNIETGEIWVGGIATAGYHIIKNGHTLVAMTHGDEYDGYDQWFSASIEFAKDDEITFINATEARGNQLPEIFGIGTVEESDEGAKFEVVDGTPKVIKAKEAVTTKVYLKLKYGMDRVYFGAEEQYIRAAKAFAKDFKDNLATACKASGQQKAVEDAWKDAVDAYALLAKEAKDELKLGALSSVEEVREFGARYTWFLEHKSTWNLDNFLGWEIQASNDVMGLTADDTTMTVVVISAIAVISAAGLFFLIRRKRRLVK